MSDDDQDELQMKDEADEEWVKGWKKAIKPALSIKQKIHLLIYGHVFLRYEGKQEGWNGTTEIYLVHCKTHGFYEDIVHGKGKFRCPKCFGEETSVSIRRRGRKIE